MRQFIVRLVLFLFVALVVFGLYRLVTIRPLSRPPFFPEQHAGPLRLADAGRSATAPPYTLAALQAAQQEGADGFYLPLWLTRDGQLVAAPSADLAEFTNGSGRIAQYTAAELAALDAAYRFDPGGTGTYPWRGRGQRLLTLAEILQAFPEQRVVADVQAAELATVAALLQAVDGQNARGRVLAKVEGQQLVEALRAQAPDLATAYTEGEARAFVTAYRLRLTPFYRPAAPALILPADQLSGRLVRAAHSRGVEVIAVATEDAQVQPLAAMGVAAVIVGL
ncbi:MAG: hypothetical protein NZ528_13820 [Caldilineales bacterium]|nr:hypothetical protein [Caldilineales bacterium]MDW8319365.1 glycerophosphodiester phosphodiesterase family protein [Anaerolineae bacterium]